MDNKELLMQNIKEHYQQLNLIGCGRSGKVYKVLDKETNRIYAAKFLGQITEKNRKYINNEINIMAKFAHETIAPIIGYALEDFDGNENVIIFMKFFERGTLTEYLENLTKRMKLDILAGVAYGMIHLHKNNIIHRDLKPANIFLDENRKPIISDFGIAKIYEGDSIEQTECKFTPLYCAPEGYDAKYCLKSDVYSFAIIIYQLYVNKDPFKEFKKNPMKLYINVVEGERPLIPGDNDADPKIIELMKQCWSPNPDDRPTFREVFDRLYEIDGSRSTYIQKLKESLNAKEEIKLNATVLPQPKKLVKKKELKEEMLEKFSNQEKTIRKMNENIKKAENNLIESIRVLQDKLTRQDTDIERMSLNFVNKDQIDQTLRKTKYMEDLNKKITSLKTENDSLRSKMTDLESNIDDLKRRKKSWNSGIEQKIKDEMNDNIKKAENNLIESIRVLQDRLTRQDTDIERMSLNFVNKDQIDQTLRKTKYMEDLNKKITSLQTANDSLKTENDSLDSKTSKLETIVNDLNLNLTTEINSRLKTTEDELNKITTSFLEKQKEEYQDIVSQVDKKIKLNLKKEMKRFEDKFNEQIKSLQDENTKLKKNLSDQKTESQNKINELEEKIEQIETKSQNKINELEEKIEEIETKSQNKINELEEKIEQMKDEFAKQQDLEQLSISISTYQSEVDENIRQEVNKYKDHIENLNSTNAKHESKIESFQKDISDQKQEIESYKKQIDDLIDNNEKIGNVLDVNELLSEVDSVHKQNENNNKIIKSLKGQISKLKIEIRNIKRAQNQKKEDKEDEDDEYQKQNDEIVEEEE